MTEAEKMAEEWERKLFPDKHPARQLVLKRLISLIAERTREECEKASTFELAPHPRWTMQVSDAIRAAKWEDEEA